MLITCFHFGKASYHNISTSPTDNVINMQVNPYMHA